MSWIPSWWLWLQVVGYDTGKAEVGAHGLNVARKRWEVGIL
jgi:hypothetical protein